MAIDKSLDEQLADLNKQIEMLQKQLALVNAQIALDAARQTQESLLATAALTALKNQAAAEFNLESEQAKLPLAELAGVKAALSGMQLPTGKSGTVTVAAGVSGKALLRSKIPMLEILYDVSEEIKTQLEQLGGDTVIVTEAQLEQACQAEIMLNHINDQIQKLKEAIETSKPSIAVSVKAFAEFAAAAYSLGFVIDTINSLAKLFRVDRQVDVFAAETEALQMLSYMLESKCLNLVGNPAMLRNGEDFASQANNLLTKLNTLYAKVKEGDNLLAQLRKIQEEEAKTKPPCSQLPAADSITNLQAQILAARSLLDGLDPSKKPDAFWSQVKGKIISQILENKNRLLLEAKAQALQITESRWWRSDRINMSGEVQIAYRILDTKGKLQKSNVILKVGRMKNNKLYIDAMDDDYFSCEEAKIRRDNEKSQEKQKRGKKQNSELKKPTKS